MTERSTKQENMKKIIWVERLNLLDAGYLFLRGIFSSPVIKYDEYNISGSAKGLLRLMQKTGLFCNFYSAKLRIGTKDQKGYALTYKLDAYLDKCWNNFCQKHVPGESSRLKHMVRQYLSHYLYERLTFLTMVEDEHDFYKPDSRERNILYFARHPLNSIIRYFCLDKGYAILESPVNFQSIRYFLRPIYHLSLILFARLSFKKVKNNIKEIKPSIWVEYCNASLIDLAFWRNEINRDGLDIVYYFDRDDDPPIATIAEELERQGIKWIDLHFRSLIQIANINLTELAELFKTLCSTSPGMPAWFKVFQFEYKTYFSLFKSVFSNFKTKIIIQHQECGWIQEAQVAAIEASQGIMIGFHWSSYPAYKRIPIMNPMHVLFVWGKFFYDYYSQKENTCRYILPSGLCAISTDKNNEPENSLSRDLTFIIAIFDSSVKYNVYQSPETLVKFYLNILDLIENNLNWGGIVKSKNWYFSELSSLSGGEEIVIRMEKLIKQERIIFLDPLSSPIVASMNAHLSVCYGLNSAGIIAGIYGYKAIHWDCAGWLHNRLYEEKDQEILYPELDEFNEAIIKASKGKGEIGDFSRWRNKFNHFDDFDASKRVGRFIQTYMDGVLDGFDRDILDNAVKTYIEENKIREEFFKTENMQYV